MEPGEFALGRNFPNPFNPETTIPFSVGAACRVRLAVYNLRGEEVAVPADGHLAAGLHTVRFDATGLPSGVYVVRMEAGNFFASRKVAVVK